MTRDLGAELRAALSDRYRIERELGQGGMATVYLAHDLKHDRQVAIKVLRPDLAATMGAERFEREIRVAARLQHPHILGVLDSGDAGGFLYYVMPYVEGETLRDRITRGGELPVADAVRLLGEIAEALAVAHRGGVVHRDIKPENILLSGRHAMVMDFGVAKAVSEASGRQQLTTAGVALGTPAYMAPEQATADPQLDHRVDIYALGVVGYEMLTGLPPFHGLTAQATLAAQVTRIPAPVVELRPGIAPVLDALIMRCLAKRPADRFQSADELTAALEPLATPSGGMTPTGTQPYAAAASASGTRRPMPAWMKAAIAAALIAVAGLGAFRALRGGKSSASDAKSVAVLPFENVGGDSTNLGFADGIQSEILTVLTRLASLQVTSRSSVLEYRHSSKSVKQIGNELGVQTLLQGQVQRAGNEVHVTVQLVDASSDRQVWAESYDREVTAQNIFSIQADIARNVAQALRASFSPAESLSAQKPSTGNLEALDWYHRAQELFASHFGVNDNAVAVGAYERAVGLDSSFAQAWAGLAKARSWQVRTGATSDTLPARVALDHAIRLAPSAPETRLARAFYAYYARGDFDAALADFRAVAAANPNDVEATRGIGYITRRQGKWDEALEAERQVTLRDPRNGAALSDYGQTHVYLRRFAEAGEILRRSLILSPLSEGANTYMLASLMTGRGDTAAARAMLAALPPGMLAGVHELYGAQLERYARHFDRANAVYDASPVSVPFDVPSRLLNKALNDLAAGDTARARQRADSAVRSARSLVEPGSGGVFGASADLYMVVGIAEAIQGHGAEAVQNAERAIQINPLSHDAVEGLRSVDALIVVHLLLGHRDEAIRLITAQAHQPADVSLIPTSPVTIRLDPLFDGVRNDPRIKALLADSAAWLVR